MALLSKWFKVATAGETIDDRTIEESWLTEIAETYDRSEYTASIFREHIPWLGNFGIVHSVKTGRDTKDRLCLYARVEPNQRLLELNKNGQALFTSISILADFAGTSKCYLGHLAITDTPASLGTDQLAFNGKNLPDDFIASQFIETDFDLDESSLNKKQKSFLQRFFSLGSDQPSDSYHDETEEDPTMKKEDQDKLFAQLETLTGSVNAMQEKLNGNKETPPAEPPSDFATRLENIEQQISKLTGDPDQSQDPEPTDFSAQLKQLTDAVTQIQSDFKSALGEQQGTDPGTHIGGSDEKIELY